MANSGQPEFCAGSEGGMDFQSCLNLAYSEMSDDPLWEMPFGLSTSEIGELPQSPVNMGTQFNSQQYVHTQPAGTSSGVVHNPHLTSNNVSRTGTPGMTAGKTLNLKNLKKRKTDQKYRERQKQEKAETKEELDRLQVENALLKAENIRLKEDRALTNQKLQSHSERIKQLEKDLSNNDKLSAIKIGRLEDGIANLRKENESLKCDKALVNENTQSLAKTIDQLGRGFTQLKSNHQTENAFAQQLAVLFLQKDKDSKFIKEEDKQDPFHSDEERQSEKEISAGNLDGGDSEDDNDSKKKKKRVARSAPSECRFGKVPKLACYNARADQRQGSTSNPTAMVIDSYTITDCLRILKTIGDIPFSIVQKARAKFESSDEREYFVGLTEDWRRDWVKELENDA